MFTKAFFHRVEKTRDCLVKDAGIKVLAFRVLTEAHFLRLACRNREEELPKLLLF